MNAFRINKYTSSFSHYIKTLEQEIDYNKRGEIQSISLLAFKPFLKFVCSVKLIYNNLNLLYVKE